MNEEETLEIMFKGAVVVAGLVMGVAVICFLILLAVPFVIGYVVSRFLFKGERERIAKQMRDEQLVKECEEARLKREREERKRMEELEREKLYRALVGRVEREKKLEAVVAKPPRVSIDLTKGYYVVSRLSDGQKQVLRDNGYELIKGRLSKAGGSTYYLVKTQSNESPDHALLSWFIAETIKKHGGKPKVAATVEADVSVEVNGKKICFEVETGSVLASHGTDYVENKFAWRMKEYDEVIVVVTNRLLKKKYENISHAQVITRAEIPDRIAAIFSKK